MTASLVICGVTCLCMILSVLFFPHVKIRKFGFDTYWVVVLAGAMLMIANGNISLGQIKDSLLADTAVNPIKILVLFICMTVLSVFLDELGFFAYLANKTLTVSGTSQTKLFFILYITVSFLTVFTSNDIIILTFTPFICYFSKNAGISPVPYLVAQFTAANTWSMLLIIGNPTNIYLATSYSVDFVTYLKTMILPGIASGVVSLFILWLVFRKKLSLPMKPLTIDVKIADKTLLAIGLVVLGGCTVSLAIGSYVGAEMWLISLTAAVVLFALSLVVSLFRKEYPARLVRCIARAPWQLVPFVISMFVMILALGNHGVTQRICDLLERLPVIYSFGGASFLSSNVINNIPMSVLFCSVIECLPDSCVMGAVFASVIGSNLGALLTPVGALAGIIWTMILKNHDVKFSYMDFIKYGVAVSIPSMLTALVVLDAVI